MKARTPPKNQHNMPFRKLRKVRKMVMKYFSRTSPYILLVALIGCTTTSSRPTDQLGGDEWTATPVDSSPVVYGGPMAVKQIGQTGLAFSKESSGYWVDLRQSKDALKQIAGLLAAGSSTQAVNAAKGYLSNHPQDVQGIMYLATALAMDKKYHLAAYYAQTGLRLRPGDGMLLNVLGLSSYLGSIRSAKEVSESLAILKQSFQGNSSQIASGLNLGGIYLELGNPAEAKVYYQEVAKRCGNCTMSLLGSGTASLRQKKFAEAKSAFEKILAKEPFHGAALFNLAVVYRNGFQNRAQAEKYLFTLLNRSGKSDMALRSRAQAFLRMMKGELNQGQRSLAGEESRSKAKGKSQGKSPGDDTSDAELLMTSGDGLGK